jgi:hypothetical protein
LKEERRSVAVSFPPLALTARWILPGVPSRLTATLHPPLRSPSDQRPLPALTLLRHQLPLLKGAHAADRLREDTRPLPAFPASPSSTYTVPPPSTRPPPSPLPTQLPRSVRRPPHQTGTAQVGTAWRGVTASWPARARIGVASRVSLVPAVKQVGELGGSTRTCKTGRSASGASSPSYCTARTGRKTRPCSGKTRLTSFLFSS